MALGRARFSAIRGRNRRLGASGGTGRLQPGELLARDRVDGLVPLAPVGREGGEQPGRSAQAPLRRDLAPLLHAAPRLHARGEEQPEPRRRFGWAGTALRLVRGRRREGFWRKAAAGEMVDARDRNPRQQGHARLCARQRTGDRLEIDRGGGAVGPQQSGDEGRLPIVGGGDVEAHQAALTRIGRGSWAGTA